MTQATDPAAPHGRDNGGNPLAPYGYKVDGTPRLSNRGATAGGNKPTGGTAPKSNRKAKASAIPGMTSNLTDDERKGMLCELADMTLVSPLASASQVPVIATRIGAAQADALAGDAFILAQYMPHIADGLILLSKTKPKTLAWLDKLEGAAPMVVLTRALMGAGKAMADNHMNPNPNVAQAGRSLAALRIAQMADAVNAEADRIQQDAQAAAFERAAFERANAA
jgi:hypothetical protein